MNKEKASRILGISLNASENEIKSAYKKLAIKFHPDKNNDPSAEEKFKEISSAYKYMLEPESEHPNINMHFNPFDSFNFNFNFNPFESMNGGGPMKCADSLHKINIKLKEAHTGLNKNFKIKIKRTCFECKETCTTCNGNGKVQIKRQMGPLTQIMSTVCSHCNGVGKKSVDKKCVTCDNKKEWLEEKTVEVTIPKCVKNGYTIQFENMGEQPSNERDIPGNLIFQIYVENNDEHFIRRNDDLIYNINISLKESIIGKFIEIPHYDKLICLDIRTFGIINPKKEYIIYNNGLGMKGNLILKFDIGYPEITLTEEHIESLKVIFDVINI